VIFVKLQYSSEIWHYLQFATKIRTFAFW